MGEKLEELEGSEFVLLPSGMLLVSLILDSGSLKVGQGCIGTGRKQFKLNQNLDPNIPNSSAVCALDMVFPMKCIKCEIRGEKNGENYVV